jgi:hypothetical protein
MINKREPKDLSNLYKIHQCHFLLDLKLVWSFTFVLYFLNIVLYPNKNKHLVSRLGSSHGRGHKFETCTAHQKYL